MIGYNALQVIELIGNVASFRGFWNVLDVYFIPGNFLYPSSLFRTLCNNTSTGCLLCFHTPCILCNGKIAHIAIDLTK